MESWEAEPYKVLEQDSFANDELLDNLLGDFDDDAHSQSSASYRRQGHQRHSSLAETMNNPLYGYSHFGEEKNVPGPPVSLTAAQPKPAPLASGTPPSKTSLPSGRKRISKEQTQILENSFQKSTHLDKAERERVCRETGLMAKNVNIWFQNRRQKAKALANKSKESEEPTQKDAAPATTKSKKSAAAPAPSAASAGQAAGKVAGQAAGSSVVAPSGPPGGPPNGPSAVPPVPKALYRTPKRNSASFIQESPHMQMQKPLMSPAVRHDGYFGLGVYETPQSPTPQYSPASTLGDFSPAQPFPHYTHANLWDAPIDQSWPLNGRTSPPARGHRKYSLMQSPQLLERTSASSPQVYRHHSSSSSSDLARAGMLSRSKSAVAIPQSAEEELEYPEMKRRRSNFGAIPTLPARSTAASSAQVSPNSSPPAEAEDQYYHGNSSGSSLGRNRAYTQPSLRYESGMRLHLDDSNHQAVLVMVDQNGQRMPRTRSSASSASISRMPSLQPVPQPTFEAPLITPDDYSLNYGQGYEQPNLLYDLNDSQFFEFPGSDQ